MKLEKIPTGTAQQRKSYYSVSDGKIMTYPSKSYTEAKRTLLRAMAPHKVAKPFKGPVLLEVQYRYETKDKRKHYKFKTTAPDGDNLLKVCKDMLAQSGFLENDANVCVEEMTRFWVPKGEGGILVHIAEISEAVYL